MKKPIVFAISLFMICCLCMYLPSYSWAFGRHGGHHGHHGGHHGHHPHYHGVRHHGGGHHGLHHSFGHRGHHRHHGFGHHRGGPHGHHRLHHGFGHHGGHHGLHHGFGHHGHHHNPCAIGPIGIIDLHVTDPFVINTTIHNLDKHPQHTETHNDIKPYLFSYGEQYEPGPDAYVFEYGQGKRDTFNLYVYNTNDK